MTEDFWYTKPGTDQDVVISTRVRLSRNLVNFPFPCQFKNDDHERVETLIFDAFSKVENPDSFQAIPLRIINEKNRKIFVERGVFDEKKDFPQASVVVRSDGKISCTINEGEHLKISAFESGFDCEGAFRIAKEIDEQLQKTVQFAANYEFGFLTSRISDSGSGMKVSVRVHLPSLTFLGKMKSIIEEIHGKDLEIDSVFGVGETAGASFGSIYQISTKFASAGTEADQLSVIVAAVKILVGQERKARAEVLSTSITRYYNEVLRSFALIKFSTLLTFREAIDFLSKIKWGNDCGLFEGIEDTYIFSLWYTLKDAHIDFLIKKTEFELEEDVQKDNELCMDRVRSLVLREALEKVKLVEK